MFWSNLAKHHLACYAMLNILLEEAAVFSPVCLRVLPQALQLYRAPCHRIGLILILSKLLRDSVMQYNAKTEVLQVCFLSHTQTHTVKRKTEWAT